MQFNYIMVRDYNNTRVYNAFKPTITICLAKVRRTTSRLQIFQLL